MDLPEVRHPAPFPVAVSWLEPSGAAIAGGEAGRPPEGGVALVMLVPDAERDVSIIKTSLSEAEERRLERIQHPRALAEFAAGRRLIREVLGRLLGVTPREVSILESERGALSLDPAHVSPLRFNLSHTEGLVVLAVATHDVGVDVEWLDRRGRTVELADRYFAGVGIDGDRVKTIDIASSISGP
ncbi:MAG TPA: hypothetical protein PK095_12125 [Myxococcota bacterium]|nr:hypothetical protein [Myxococcota bacterium]